MVLLEQSVSPEQLVYREELVNRFSPQPDWKDDQLPAKVTRPSTPPTNSSASSAIKSLIANAFESSAAMARLVSLAMAAALLAMSVS